MTRLRALLRRRLSRLFATRIRTMFGTVRIYDDRFYGRPARLLDVKGSLQSATYLDDDWCIPPFAYLRLFDRVFDVAPPPRELLMLGGGGFAFPKHVIAHRGPARIDVVEIDPVIIEIAHDYFFLDRLADEYPHDIERLTTIEGDAVAHLRLCKQRNKRYDVILNDCYALRELDSELMRREGLKLVVDCLTPQGLYATNLISALEGTDAAPLYAFVTELSAHFAYVGAWPTNLSDPDVPDNVVVVAAHQNPGIPETLTLFESLQSDATRG